MAEAPDQAADRRVARLDGIDGGEAASAPVARFGELFGSPAAPAGHGGAAAAPETPAPADLGRIGAGEQQAAPLANLATDPHASEDGAPGPVALFDTADLAASRADVTVADLDPGVLRRPAGRRGGARTGRDGRDTGSQAGRGRSERRRAAGGVSARPGASETARPGRGVPVGPAETDGPDQADRPDGSPRAGRPGGRRGRWPGGREELDPDADPVAIAREVCLRLLTDRARTRQELAQALRRKGVPDDAAHSVLERFDEVGLIDDAAFAGQWVRSRHSQRGLARRAIAMELRRKGVSDEDAGEALAEVDTESEERRARELVDRKLRSLAVATAEQRAAAGRRLVGMLARKGYGAGIAYRVVKEALAERGAESDELGDAEIPDD
jgi:regulatory protein